MGDAIRFRQRLCRNDTEATVRSADVGTTDCVIEHLAAFRDWTTDYLVGLWNTSALLPSHLAPAMAQVRLPPLPSGLNKTAASSRYGSLHPRLLAELGIEVVLRQGYDSAHPEAWWTRLSCQIFIGHEDVSRFGHAVLRMINEP